MRFRKMSPNFPARGVAHVKRSATPMLYAAALLIFATGLAYWVLGERYRLVRLFKRENRPKVLASTSFTVETLRFVWHLTTAAWWGFAYLLVLAEQDQVG